MGSQRVGHDRDFHFHYHLRDFPGGTSGKEPGCQSERHKRYGFNSWVGKISWRRKWLPTPAFLPRKFHGQRSLVSYSSWGCRESEMTEQLALSHFQWRSRHREHLWTQWGKERVGQIESAALKHTHYHMQNREPAGICSVK